MRLCIYSCEDLESKERSIIIVLEDKNGGIIDEEDKDNDLIPDEWERDYGLDPNNSTDADEDLDNDGLINATVHVNNDEELLVKYDDYQSNLIVMNEVKKDAFARLIKRSTQRGS